MATVRRSFKARNGKFESTSLQRRVGRTSDLSGSPARKSMISPGVNRSDAPTRTNPRNRRLSSAELNVRIHSARPGALRAGQRPRYAPSPYSSHPSGRPPAVHASRRQRLRLVEASCGRDQTSGLASSRSVDTVVYQTDDLGSCQPTRGQGRCGWRFMDGFHKQRPHPFWGHDPIAVMAAVREDRH